MADNYLEQRMEDLRTGRLRSSLSAASRPSAVKRRVLVAAGTTPLGMDIARRYLRRGFRVAIFGFDAEAGREMAYREGVRFHHLPSGEDREATEAAFANLLKAWRDVDIVIIPHVAEHQERMAETLAAMWDAHRRRYPIPTDFGGEFILLHPDGETPSGIPQISTLLSQHDITTKYISTSQFIDL